MQGLFPAMKSVYRFGVLAYTPAQAPRRSLVLMRAKSVLLPGDLAHEQDSFPPDSGSPVASVGGFTGGMGSPRRSSSRLHRFITEVLG